MEAMSENGGVAPINIARGGFIFAEIENKSVPFCVRPILCLKI